MLKFDAVALLCEGRSAPQSKNFANFARVIVSVGHLAFATEPKNLFIRGFFVKNRTTFKNNT